VGGVRLLQGAALEGDRARLIAARIGDAAMEPPQRREQNGWQRLAERVRRPAEGRLGLSDVTLQEQGLAQGGADGQFVEPLQGRFEQRPKEVGSGLGLPALHVRSGPGHDRLEWRTDHRRSIPSIHLSFMALC
jgi:hypothetical protein